MKLTEIIKKITCNHDSYCSKKRFNHKKHCSLDYAKTCEISKDYEMYGIGYDRLGVGS